MVAVGVGPDVDERFEAAWKDLEVARVIVDHQLNPVHGDRARQVDRDLDVFAGDDLQATETDGVVRRHGRNDRVALTTQIRSFASSLSDPAKKNLP